MSKPSYPKPQLYAYYFELLKNIAREYGYNLLLHGSMNRDCDLVAVPWVNDPKPELELIHALSKALTGHVAADGYEKQIYMMSTQPGGRHCYIINMNRGGYKRNENGDIADPIEFTEDPQYYLDISVTPLVVSNA